MKEYIIQRILYMCVVLIFVSILSFVIIQLPPGDFLTSYILELKRGGTDVDEARIAALQRRYGLDQPLYVRYFKWITNFIRGDLGYSYMWNRPVGELIWERLLLTVVISLSSTIFVWIVAFPIGVLSALRQYSIVDYLFTAISFIGLAVPSFMLALLVMYVGFQYFGVNVGGLFSATYQEAPWSWGKFTDLLSHLWVPVIVLGVSGTAGLVRIMRANLLDELGKPYVVAAKAKGLDRAKLVLKYPVRIALNPFISTLGWQLPMLISGEVIVSVVLNLPTTGPLLLSALRSQDMYLAGSFVMLLSIATVIGTFISDMLLAWADPRIRYE